jgi:hypothetical protein
VWSVRVEYSQSFSMRIPEQVIHSDWGTKAAKRWSVRARLHAGRYVLDLPTQFDASMFPDDRVDAGTATLLGFDFAIGVPRAYACAPDFHFLSMIREAPVDLFEPAAAIDALCAERPFLRAMPRGSTEAGVLRRIGLEPGTALRRCEHPAVGSRRPAACCLFLPKPIKQVAGATRTGWREVLQPGLRSPARAAGRVRFWPFDGDLDDLVQPGTVTLAETYPAEFYERLGLPGNAKRDPKWRTAQGLRLDEVARELDVTVPDELRRDILSGFGQGTNGEDRFDALVGVLGMLRVVRSVDPCDAPRDDTVRRIEGWILGRRSDAGASVTAQRSRSRAPPRSSPHRPRRSRESPRRCTAFPVLRHRSPGRSSGGT